MKPIVLIEETSLKTGLSEAQAASRRRNISADDTKKPLGQMIREQVFSYFNLVNYFLAAIVIFTGSWRNLLFMFVVLANTVTSLYQEIRSRRVLDKLALIHQQKYSVLRNGKMITLPIDEIVQGDLIALKTGAQVPCDGVIRQGECQVNESLLTGESDPIDRSPGGSLYGGCFIVSGSCLMQAALVGSAQYMAAILKDARREKQFPSQLRDSLNTIIRFCSWILFPAGLLLFIKQYWLTGVPLNEALLSTVASMVGMIPEGLVILTTAALMTASVKMARKAVLIQELYCTESLARVDVLCLDKTGTITSGKMNVTRILPMEGQSQQQIEQDLADLYDSLEDDNLTAQALRSYLYKIPARRKASRLFPFSSSSKCSGAVFENETLIAGAYSFIFSKEDPAILEQIDTYARQGYRVLVLAKAPALERLAKGDYQLLALILIEDEIRPDAGRILSYFEEQGVAVKIISGDMPQTVAAIARKAGVEGEAIDMSRVSDSQIPEAVKTASIFGRVSPEQKKLMVQALQQQDHTVAMTGDGVNDVMALKQADCSIAMGSGAQAAMAVASMVLLQDQFSALPRIVLEGRRVINNIERTSSLFLVKTLFSFLLAVLTVIWLAEYPFVPIQLTLVSSLGTGIPAFILTFENSTSRIRGNFLVRVLSRAIPGALAVCAGICACYALMHLATLHMNTETYRTLCTALAGINAICVLYMCCRPLSFLRLLVVVACAAGLYLLMAFVPSIFMLEHLSWKWLGVLAGLGIGQVGVFWLLNRVSWKRLLGNIQFLRK